MRHAVIAAPVLALAACAPAPEVQMGGLPADFPPEILTDMPASDRAGVEEVIALYSTGLAGYCTEQEIAAALALPTVMTWVGYADTLSPEAVAYVEANHAALAAGYTSLPQRCRERVAALAEQIPE